MGDPPKSSKPRWGRRKLLQGLAVAGAAQTTGCLGRKTKLRLASGTEGSAVHQLGTALAETFNAHLDDIEVEVVEGEETRDSLTTVIHGEAELALAYSDTEGDGDIRTLVPLYELYLYMIVHNDDPKDEEHPRPDGVPGLAGLKVGIGPKGSGTDLVARRLMSHYGFTEDNPTGPKLINDSYRNTSDRFIKRDIDAVFILGSIESSAVERMLADGHAKLLSLDDPERVAPAMDGIRSKHPFVVSHVIPKHLFGKHPSEPTGVIGVHALLVSRADVDDAVARALTEAVFQHKVELGQKVRRLRELDERFDIYQLRYPLHPGASQYYRRDVPPEILEWADTISLGITVAIMGYSGVMALAARRRRKSKGVLDELYADFQAVVHTYDEEHETPPDEMTRDELVDIREHLMSLRRRSFRALTAGEVEANEAFVVFNDYLRWELQEIERVLRDRRAGIGPSVRAPSSEPPDDPQSETSGETPTET